MIEICDVGPRDGLQNEATTLSVDQRLELVTRLVGAGLPAVEVASMANPKRVPQMAGAEEILDGLPRESPTRFSTLVLNQRGYERLGSRSVDEVHLVFACTESLNQRNANASVDESLAVTTGLVEQCHRDGRRVTVTLGVAFGCPYEGEVKAEVPLALAERVAGHGVDAVVFADTIGVAVPRQIKDVVGPAAAFGVPVGLHLHNTRSTGYANVMAGLELGVEMFDASVGGAGGCPFAPNASGNIATEDLVYLLDREGLRTGVDLDAVIDIGNWLEKALGHRLDGMLHRSGGFPFAPAVEQGAAVG
jgi:hydroxymethylglutaryl-CoA lyase/(R)-citramalyl-CoA lyase